jgi:hypothetical protein
MEEDFPRSQFNHATVFVPNKGDTIWLECTSQTNPFGYSGTFTGDRKALAITEDGAVIVNTPRYATEQNVISREADVYVEAGGNAKAKVKSTYSGLEYETGQLNFIVDRSADDQKKWVEKNTEIPSFDVNGFSMKLKKDRIPSTLVSLDLTLNRLATVSGKRLFLTPNLMSRSSFIPENVADRKTAVVLKQTFTHVDTIRYHIPNELYPEFLPPPVTLKTRFGTYEASFILDQGSVVYIRKMIMKKGTFPRESYKEFVDFCKTINKSDNMKLVFLNKT